VIHAKACKSAIKQLLPLDIGII